MSIIDTNLKLGYEAKRVKENKFEMKYIDMMHYALLIGVWRFDKP